MELYATLEKRRSIEHFDLNSSLGDFKVIHNIFVFAFKERIAFGEVLGTSISNIISIKSESYVNFIKALKSVFEALATESFDTKTHFHITGSVKIEGTEFETKEERGFIFKISDKETGASIQWTTLQYTKKIFTAAKNAIITSLAVR